MKTLILSCNTGEGHNSCAKAVKEYYDLQGVECDIEDALRFIKNYVSSVTAKGHIFLYRHLPQLFNWGYSFAEKHPSAFGERSFIYNLIALGAKKLNRLICDNGYDNVICTHPFAAMMLTEVRNRYETQVKSSLIATDYTCCPSVKDSKLDYYFIPDKGLKNEFVCDNIPAESIIPSGIPVKQAFFSSVDKEKAKEMVGINPKNKHIVMMSGSMGCGPISDIVEFITKEITDGCDLTVICGTNERLRKDLLERLSDRSNVHIKGFVTDISTMLDSADVYLTKPGGISTTEAAIKGLPMLFIDAVAACETYNLLWFVGAGVAAIGDDEKELADICISLLDDEERFSEMQKSYCNVNRKNAAEIIFETLK